MNFFDKVVHLSQKYISDQATFQNVCGTAAMFLSCMAFTGSVLFNKGVPKEQKEFLVSQELADGAINVALFWTMTGQFNKMAKKAVETGRLFPKEVKEKVEQVRQKVGENAVFKDMAKEFTPEELKKISDFHSGFKNTVSLGGSLLAVSIITPIVRNIIASTFQNRDNNEKPVASVTKNEGKVYVADKPSPTPKKPLPTTYQVFSSKSGMRV